jgi:ATP-independent RNA helicase DbpA
MQLQTSKSNEELSFANLNLQEELVNTISSLGYSAMTSIQASSLPIMLNKQDVIAQAQTGSGKTVAFGLTLLNNIEVDNYSVQALVLCPTRELAEQVCQVLRQLARSIPNVKILNLSGGTPMKWQLDSLKHSAHIIVGTPGRIRKHLDKGSLLVNDLQTLVLDEADRMLDMGFFDEIYSIIKLCPKKRQTLLFSATFPEEIKKISNQFMIKPKEVIDDSSGEKLDIDQIFYEVKNKESKFSLLKSLLIKYKLQSAIIFCNTKEQTSLIAKELCKEGFSAIALNGDMSQLEREIAVIKFKNESCSILVATDVAARGIDIKELPAVINYEIAYEHDTHIHRIGRTGRAGAKGLALNLITPGDTQRVRIIQDNLNYKLTTYSASSIGDILDGKIISPKMATLCLSLGKKDKIRPGDILGALTKDAGLPVDMIGKIDIAVLASYVALHKSQVNAALSYFRSGKLKGRKVTGRKI